MDIKDAKNLFAGKNIIYDYLIEKKGYWLDNLKAKTMT